MLPAGEGDQADATADNRVQFDNPMYDGKNAAAAAAAGEASTHTNGGNAIDEDYAEIAVVTNTTVTGAVMEDGNNTYDMQAPRRRRTNSTGNQGGSAASTIKKCTRPSPNGGMCKNNALEGTAFCKGHSCPASGCTAGKSTKMATCEAHVHSSTGINQRSGKTRGGCGGSGGKHAANLRPESGEVFYDAIGSAVVAAAAGGGGADSSVNDLYAVSTKVISRAKKQQQQRANATYATPMRPVPVQDYVALNEMQSNDEASVMYDVPAASSASGGGGSAAVPEPTKVGTGVVLLGAASKRMDGEDDDEEMDC